VDITPDGIATDLADLRGVALDELCLRAARDVLTPFREALISQVERPRLNIGQGPPGRAD